MNGLIRAALRARLLVLACASFGLVLSSGAAWYWPFDLDPDSTNKPPRLHRLLEKANDYIELAEDDALSGEGDKAIENYRLALKELDRVEEEHPERAETPEFAPLRNKRATCTAAIDAIRFAQINENARAVALTNTKDLERKWRRKHGLLTPEDIEEDRREELRKQAEAAKKEGGAANATNVASAVSGTSPAEGSDWDARRSRAVALVRAQDYAAADRLLADLLKERPDDLTALLLRAASQMGLDQDHAARRTLETALRAHPKSYLPCYNLASVYLKLGEPVTEARFFYEKGRALGGPRNEALEEKFK